MIANVAFDQPEAKAAGERPAEAVDGRDLRPVPRVSIQVFCESQDVAEAVTAAAADRRMVRAHVKVHMGGIGAATEYYGAAPTPNVIIVESALPRERLFAELDRLAGVCDPGSKVVVVGRVNDIDLYRELARRGVSEYMVAPVSVLGIVSTIASLFGRPDAEPLGRTVAFVGSKGGVGSSTVSHCVAFSLARSLGGDVVLADLDLAFGTAGLDFNQDPVQGIAEALHAPERLDEVFLDRLLARCTDHLSLLAAPASLDRTFDFGEAAMEPVIDAAQANVPLVVLDLPHMWTAWVKRTILAADDIVLTVEPDLANLRNAKNMVDLLKQTRKNDAPPLVVINRVGVPKRPEIKVEEFAKALGVEPIAIIPFEPHLFGTAANNGQVILEIDAKGAPAIAFDRIANAVSGRSAPRRAVRPGLSGILSRLRKKKTG